MYMILYFKLKNCQKTEVKIAPPPPPDLPIRYSFCIYMAVRSVSTAQTMSLLNRYLCIAVGVFDRAGM
jgi:hypothetical protein